MAEARSRLEAVLEAIGLDPAVRPERIEPEAWLALARRIVNRHGGWIRAEGSPGAGATFTFALPALADDE